jgi:hypothetical protein
MDATFCLDTLHEAIDRYGTPEIFNSYQCSQFTSLEFTNSLISNGIKISMDGKGRWVDNVIIERAWKSVKYEEVYLKAYESIHEARESLNAYFEYYNCERRHQGLDRKTPYEVYWGTLPQQRAAASTSSLHLKVTLQLSQTFRPLLMTRAQQSAYEQQVALEMQITITTNSCQVLQIFHCCSTLACCTCAAVVT